MVPHVRLNAPFGFEQIRRRFEIPETFPGVVLEEARSAPMADLPRIDATAIPFVAIDPEGAVDLDQAFWGQVAPHGFDVRYAIADPASFVRPDGPLDREARRRGVTIYSPDGRSPLHPPVLSENRASLLPGGHRPALLWSFGVDRDGEVVESHLCRAMIRVDEAISYRTAQHRIDTESDSRLLVLRAVGELRIRGERLRGGVSLGLPTQRVVETQSGYLVEFEAELPVERWNAQISLLTGMQAAKMMGDAGVGIVRTLPEPDPSAIARLRRDARALGLDWDPAVGYPAFVGSLGGRSPMEAAFLMQAVRTLRGADYEVVESVGPPPAHGAIGAPYAHVTAPLRRLVDRFANEILLAITAGEHPPSWATEALAGLPALMRRAHQRQNALERAMIDHTEAVVLSSHLGEVFDATVVDLRSGGSEAVVMLGDHAVITGIDQPGLQLGQRLRLELLGTDSTEGTLDFRPLR